MDDLFKAGALIAGSVLARLIKTFDESVGVPERVRRIAEGPFLTGQDFLRRIRQAEVGLRDAEAKGQEKARKETDELTFCLNGARKKFADAAGVLKRTERGWALYYYAVCAGKAGYHDAANRELEVLKSELVAIRDELRKKEPGKPGFGSLVFAALVFAGVFPLGGWLGAIIAAVVALLMSVLIIGSVSPQVAAELVDVCELGRLLPDELEAAWAVPRWALANASKQQRRVGAAPA
jgi:hypothetical protein